MAVGRSPWHTFHTLSRAQTSSELFQQPCSCPYLPSYSYPESETTGIQPFFGVHSIIKNNINQGSSVGKNWQHSANFKVQQLKRHNSFGGRPLFTVCFCHQNITFCQGDGGREGRREGGISRLPWRALGTFFCWVINILRWQLICNALERKLHLNFVACSWLIN